ncbi:hypothetical protein VTN00DRAFT_899 [Thermoascus crustaceus]|uniref:uncharacterized protein n=1 Tax=Thermoascus crustaceus TaxID=5088 RepID=UPI0037440F60
MRLLNILTHLDFVITGFNFTMTPSPFGHSQGFAYRFHYPPFLLLLLALQRTGHSRRGFPTSVPADPDSHAAYAELAGPVTLPGWRQYHIVEYFKTVSPRQACRPGQRSSTPQLHGNTFSAVGERLPIDSSNRASS